MPPLKITFLRTSMLLLEAEGARILTDPWFGMVMRIVPVFRKPGIPIDQLGHLDGVLASHCHPDHFERASVERFTHPRLTIVGCAGIEQYTAGMVSGPVIGLRPWETADIGPFHITATPALHTNPPPPEVNYLIDVAGLRVFFGGDTRYSPAFEAIADRGPIDVALLPIGGTLIFGHRTTMNPADAVRAANILKPRVVIPIHEGGEWMPMPPASWHPGRNHHFVRDLARSRLPVEARVLAPGESAEFWPRT